MSRPRSVGEWFPALLILAFLPMALTACGGEGGGDPETGAARGSVTTAAGTGTDQKAAVDIEMECNSVVGAYEVSAEAARAVLPAQYELALQPSGNALVYLQTSTCAATGNGETLDPLDLADAWLAIQDPEGVQGEEPPEIPGDPPDLTIPLYVYVLKAQTTSKWLKTHCAAVHFAKELVREVEVGGPAAPGGSGYVEEMTGAGYAWTEIVPCMTPPGSSEYGECWMFPGFPIPVGFRLAPYPVGIDLKGFIDQGNGTGARKAMGCRMNMVGQGLIQLELDPRSHMAALGIFQSPHYGYFYAAEAVCHLVMSEDPK